MSEATDSLRERKKAQTREAIIREARALFQRKGFEATTVEEIAEAANIHKQTVLRYFSSKEEIALAFRMEAFEELRRSLDDPGRTDSVITTWRRHVEWAAKRVARRGDFYWYAEFIESDPRLHAAALRLEILHEELLARAMSEEAGVDSSQDLHSRLLATLLVGGSRAAGRMILQNRAADRMEELSLAVVDFAIEHFPERRGRHGV